MRIVRSIFAVHLSGAILLATGCGGGGDQSDGQLVTPTEEVQQSRAAIEKAVESRPNMYAPPKDAQSRSR